MFNDKKHPGFVVNLWAGPGVGKSTMALDLTSKFKKSGYDAEYVSEYVKKLVYKQASEIEFNDQNLITAQQHSALFQACHSRMNDFVVSDAPLLLGLEYLPQEHFNISTYEPHVKSLFDKFNNINVFLNRMDREYNPKGRLQTREEAMRIDESIRIKLENYGLEYLVVDADESSIPTIIEYALMMKEKLEQ